MIENYIDNKFKIKQKVIVLFGVAIPLTTIELCFSALDKFFHLMIILYSKS